MHLYEGPVPVCHFDLYRVARTDEWVAMEVEEQMDGHHIVLIEWPIRSPGCSGGSAGHYDNARSA